MLSTGHDNWYIVPIVGTVNMCSCALYKLTVKACWSHLNHTEVSWAVAGTVQSAFKPMEYVNANMHCSDAKRLLLVWLANTDFETKTFVLDVLQVP